MPPLHDKTLQSLVEPGFMLGGATWNSSVKRDQLRDCANLLGKLVPVIILLMLDNPDTLYGYACYPVVV